jgi:hypothetical protein
MLYQNMFLIGPEGIGPIRRLQASDTKPLTASKGWLSRFRNRLRLKKQKKYCKGCVCQKKEAAAIFPAELKLIKEKKYHLEEDAQQNLCSLRCRGGTKART